MGLPPPMSHRNYTAQSLIGPGNYHVSDEITRPNVHSVKFTPGTPNRVINRRSVENTPDPGSYSPNDKFTKFSTPAIKFNPTNRNALNSSKNNTPGPGHYSMNVSSFNN